MDRYLTELGVIQPHNSDNPHRRWISTGTTFFQARSGVVASSKTSGIGAHKPDVTLVTNVTNQVHHRFFVGALLTGPEMRIAIFTRGCGAFSEPIDIYADPVKYMQVLFWFMHTELWYLGYDPYYQAPTSTDNLSLWLMKTNSTTEEDMVLTMVLLIIYSGIAGFGRTTRMMAVRGSRRQLGVDQETLIVKEVWQVDRFVPDGEIHQLLEDKERLQKAHIKLGAF